MDTPYEQGKLAFYNNLKWHNNPYILESENYNQWKAGFNAEAMKYMSQSDRIEKKLDLIIEMLKDMKL